MMLQVRDWRSNKLGKVALVLADMGGSMLPACLTAWMNEWMNG